MNTEIHDHIHYRAQDTGFTVDQVQAGTPATLSIGSDTYPGTVEEVVRNDAGVIIKVSVRRDETRGNNEAQVFIPDANGKLFVFTRRRNGRLTEMGRPIGQGFIVNFGFRSAFRDPDF